jgi:hypothetical protein
MKSKKALGVDIGNVIINHRNYQIADSNGREIHEENYSAIPAADGAFGALKKLNGYFDGKVYLISKCTEWAEERILKWLDDNDLYSRTGIDSKNVHFVRERHEKDAACRKLGITHFIDDRLEVLSHMIKSTPNLYLFMPDEREVEEFKEFLPKVKVVTDWEEALAVIEVNG